MTIDYRNFKFKEASANDMGPTMGQFLHFIDFSSHVIDSNKSWSENEKKTYVLENLSGTALRWSKANIKHPENLDWTDIKRKLIDRFYVKLNIRQKVQLRRELSQRFDESCQDFLDRCKKYQYLVCDDDIESVTERDILINFLLGIRSDFFDALMSNDKIETLDAFFVEAVKYEAMLHVKQEAEDLEEPVMAKMFSGENIKMEVPFEPEVLLSKVS